MLGDEGPRRSCSAERLILLPTVGGTRTITAGNAPALSDGAAFVALASKRAVGTYGLRPIAEICDYVQVAGGATSGSYTPALAIERLIHRNGLTRDGLDAIEINEAFAATPPVSLLRLNDMDSAAAARMAERTNRRGGAVALGHPLGASGARIVMSAAVSLRQRGGGTAAAAICGGFGQGDALLLKA